MGTVALPRRRKRTLPIGPGDNGMIMTPEQFDRADYQEGWRYELIHGVLVVSPIPSEQEVDPNEELGHRLRQYRAAHPQGKALDKTLPERLVYLGDTRRRPDRVIWAGLGRLPRPKELPAIIVEFVSRRRRDRLLDYETKRDEFMEAGIREYWVIDRFQRIMSVFFKVQGKIRKKVIRANQNYHTELLPGFELRLADLLTVADDWVEEAEEESIP